MRNLLRVGSHNIMDGHLLHGLLNRYRSHQKGPNALHALCIQEAVPRSAPAIAAALGCSFVAAADAAAPRLAFVYDRSRLRLRSLRVLSLPLLDRLPLWQSMYTGIERRYALVGLFDWRSARSSKWRGRVALANFHLDTGGELPNRTAQLEHLAKELGANKRRLLFGRAAAGPLPLVACGDTNCFAWDAAQAERDLVSLLSPLERHHGAVDAHDFASIGPTHYFARANEPQLAHKIAVAFGKLGVDFPRRYDVVTSSLPVASSGAIETPESDHDLVWAAMGGRVGKRRF